MESDTGKIPREWGHFTSRSRDAADLLRKPSDATGFTRHRPCLSSEVEDVKAMTMDTQLLTLIFIGLATGVLSGVFGIGGGIIIVPALIYLAGFRQQLATGTSLAVLLPPVGVGAVLEYYRHGNVNLFAAFVMAGAMMVGGYFGAILADRISGPSLRLAFGVFVLCLGAYLIVGASKRLGWF
jgi:uncharacterized membrane protein YfcA